MKQKSLSKRSSTALIHCLGFQAPIEPPSRQGVPLKCGLPCCRGPNDLAPPSVRAAQHGLARSGDSVHQHRRRLDLRSPAPPQVKVTGETEKVEKTVDSIRGVYLTLSTQKSTVSSAILIQTAKSLSNCEVANGSHVRCKVVAVCAAQPSCSVSSLLTPASRGLR